MAKQWATRVIVAFQTLCWCTAILLLLTRGLANLRASHEAPGPANATATAPGPWGPAPAGQGYALGVGLIVVAGLMIVASPAIIVARAYDRRRYASVNQFPDLGLPPRYEDVVSRAPSYSSLFDTEAQQLHSPTTPAIVVKVNPPIAPASSPL